MEKDASEAGKGIEEINTAKMQQNQEAARMPGKKLRIKETQFSQ